MRAGCASRSTSRICRQKIEALGLSRPAHGLFDSSDAATLFGGMCPVRRGGAGNRAHLGSPGECLDQAGVDVAFHIRAGAVVTRFAPLAANEAEAEMPGLVRGCPDGAVVGTATATRNAVNRRQANKNAQAYAQATNAAHAQTAPPQQQYPVEPQQALDYAPSVDPNEEVISQLERLGALYAQGLLNDEEFAAAKHKLIG
jgi:hypothetical protein